MADFFKVFDTSYHNIITFGDYLESLYFKLFFFIRDKPPFNVILFYFLCFLLI